ncbi:hypothetical protein T07_5178 [Trichinella nelsoni]|uniref:Uncharacterized protein n=1 Tax=Trichinella nelsoni TaxID=6336 RepID=A0A0V0RG10_9BILA|nr:hypothetical protein T07_5178 [Trichinella nelsoni]
MRQWCSLQKRRFWNSSLLGLEENQLPQLLWLGFRSLSCREPFACIGSSHDVPLDGLTVSMTAGKIALPFSAFHRLPVTSRRNLQTPPNIRSPILAISRITFLMDVGMNKAEDEKISVILRVGLGIIFAIQVSSMFPDGNDVIYSYASLDLPHYEDDSLHCFTCIDENSDWFNLFSDLNERERAILYEGFSHEERFQSIRGTLTRKDNSLHTILHFYASICLQGRFTVFNGRLSKKDFNSCERTTVRVAQNELSNQVNG